MTRLHQSKWISSDFWKKWTDLLRDAERDEINIYLEKKQIANKKK
jgi:hypothetical protein